jgi:hypothetical protein
MKSLTPQQIVDLNPCKGYDLKQVTELFDNRKSVTYLEILDTDKIPLVDIIWVFCQLTVLDDNIRDQWTEVIVTRAVTNYALHCGVDTVEKWAKNWLSGDDRTIKAAVSARNAAINARTVVYSAYAFIAACTAARAAACAAYYVDVADIDAAYGAYDTALKTERKQQIQDLKDIL